MGNETSLGIGITRVTLLSPRLQPRLHPCPTSLPKEGSPAMEIMGCRNLWTHGEGENNACLQGTRPDFNPQDPSSLSAGRSSVFCPVPHSQYKASLLVTVCYLSSHFSVSSLRTAQIPQDLSRRISLSPAHTSLHCMSASIFTPPSLPVRQQGQQTGCQHFKCLRRVKGAVSPLPAEKPGLAGSST